MALAFCFYTLTDLENRNALVFNGILLMDDDTIQRSTTWARLLIQSDNKEAIKLLNDKDATSNSCALVRSIVKLRNLGWATTTHWISRTGNEPTDRLAKFDNLPCYNTSYFDQPPQLLVPLFDFDILNSL
ncbi:hypothetical protein GQ457_01G026750 [Hibiscus cannabinus]